MPRPFKPLSELKYPRRPNGGHPPFNMSLFFDGVTWNQPEILLLCKRTNLRNHHKRRTVHTPVREFHTTRTRAAALLLRDYLLLVNLPYEIFLTTSTHRALTLARRNCFVHLTSHGYTTGVIAFVCNCWRTSVTSSLQTLSD